MASSRSWMALLGLVVGCGKDDSAAQPVDSGDPEPTETASPGDSETGGDTGAETGRETGETAETGGETGETSETAETGDTGPKVPVYDCAKMPMTPDPETIVPGARGSKGLAFDADGHIVGTDGFSLVKAPYGGKATVWIPGANDVEQLAYLSGGDLISAYGYGAGEVKRYTPKGATTVIVGGLDAYSVAIAPNDTVYVAGWNGAFMVDPDTGTFTQFLTYGPPDFPPGASPRTLAFSRDHTQLFVGTIDNSGRVFTLPLDKDFVPSGPLQEFARGLGSGWHDGLGIDVCGYVYAVDYATASLYRASPDGKTVDKLVDWSANRRELAHGLVFGNGIGGWRVDAIYLPESQNGNQVKEIVLGVPWNMWEGDVIHAP